MHQFSFLLLEFHVIGQGFATRSSRITRGSYQTRKQTSSIVDAIQKFLGNICIENEQLKDSNGIRLLKVTSFKLCSLFFLHFLYSRKGHILQNMFPSFVRLGDYFCEKILNNCTFL